MEYRGIEYEVKISTEPRKWIWVVHTPNPKRGVTASRKLAISIARRTIDIWCRKNPTKCKPISHNSDPLMASLT